MRPGISRLKIASICETYVRNLLTSSANCHDIMNGISGPQTLGICVNKDICTISTYRVAICDTRHGISGPQAVEICACEWSVICPIFTYREWYL